MSGLKNVLKYRAEDEEYTSEVNLIQAKYENKFSIPEWLEHAESGFKWLKSLKWNLGIIAHGILKEKFLDYKNQGPDYGFEKYALLLTLLSKGLFETCKKEDEDEDGTEDEDKDTTEDEDDTSSEEDVIYPIDVEKTYIELKAVVEEMRCREGDVMYTRIGPAMEHVLTATRANLLHLMGRDEESKQMAKNLMPVDNMSLENKAGLDGIRAKFIVHMYQDMTVGLEAVKQSMELDPDFAYWKYLAAKVMRRHRRFLKLEMQPEELEYFEKAVALERNPKFLVFLAQAYQEVAFTMLRGNTGLCSQDPKTMLETAVQLFRECWLLKNDSASISRRVGNGIMKMRGDNFDFKLAKEALHKAVELSPNSVTYHALGKLYLYHVHDEEKALEYFNAIKADYCTGEIIRYKLINDPESDISEHIKYWTVFAVSKVKQDVIWCDIGWYYLCIQRNIFKATRFFWKVLSKDSHSFRVLNFESYAFVVKGPLNMLKILVNEVLLALEKFSEIPEATEGCAALNDFLEKVYEKHPHLREITPDRELLPNIKRNVIKELAKLKRWMYGRGDSRAGKQNNMGNWRTRSEGDVGGNNGERSNNTVNNWRSHGNRTEGDTGEGSLQSSWNRTRLSSGEIGETNREMDRNNRGRRGSENEEQNHNGGRNQRWNDRHERYNKQNLGTSENQRNVRSENGQTRSEPRERRQSYNSRYDTTVTNWRTENRN